MAEKNLKVRIQHKHDTEERWLATTDFIPKQGEIIVYDIDETHSYARFKIGDGLTEIKQLPFSTDTTLAISGMAADAKLTGDELKKRITIDLENSEEGEANPIDADTLGGVSADDYALKEDLENFSSGSDWGQNDSEAKDFIKNRTHYVFTTEFACDQNLGSYSIEGRAITKVQEYSVFERNAAYNNHLISLTLSDGSVEQLALTTTAILGGGRGDEGEVDLSYLYCESKKATEALSLYIISPDSGFGFSGIFVTEGSSVTNIKIQSFKILQSDYLPVVPVAKGGTGSSNPSDGRYNLLKNSSLSTTKLPSDEFKGLVINELPLTANGVNDPIGGVLLNIQNSVNRGMQICNGYTDANQLKWRIIHSTKTSDDGVLGYSPWFTIYHSGNINELMTEITTRLNNASGVSF